MNEWIDKVFEWMKNEIRPEIVELELWTRKKQINAKSKINRTNKVMRLNK